MERTAAEAGAIDTSGLPTEDRITRDMLKVIAELQIEEDDQHLYELKVVDQMSGPQQRCCRSSPSSSRRIRPSGSTRSSPACTLTRHSWRPMSSF